MDVSPAPFAPLVSAFLGSILLATGPASAESGPPSIPIPNAGFEDAAPLASVPVVWEIGISSGTRAAIVRDGETRHSGRFSVRIEDRSPTAPNIYAFLRSPAIPVEPETTYDIRLFAKARKLANCSIGVDMEAGDTFREPLPAGTYDWREVTLTAATQPGQHTLRIHILADGPTEALWIDDVSMTISARRRAGLVERSYPRDFSGMYPRSRGKVGRHLLVCDTTKLPDELIRPLVALQGIVNREDPSLYLISRTTDPALIDEMWLAYMKEKGYTDEEERLGDPVEIVRRFRDRVRGLIVIDPDLPGSINASWMLAGLLDALPASPETASALGKALNLPVVMDLRGRWKRNVDAYRFVYENYWDRMSHHALAWQFPPSRRFGTQDYLVEHRIFQLWVSSPDDREKGGDPAAEMDFAHEILAATPGAIPMFGWVAGDDPKQAYLTEYAFAHLCSEYGKFIPGTDLMSNASVHGAIQLEGQDAVFRQKSRAQPPRTKLEPDKVYVAFSIMDCDGIGCWQGFWQRIFADPLRGAVPMGCGMQLGTIDLMPLVQRWYYDRMTPAETFYGLVYFNEPLFANRFRKEDRERIWARWIAYVDEHCRLLDLDGVELLWSGVRRPNLPREGVLRRYTQGVKNLNYIVAEIGRGTRADIPTDECTYKLDDTVVFHTVNSIHTWAANEDFRTWTMDGENAYILDELRRFPPSRRPAFLNVVGLCWRYNPTWIMDLKRKLPPDYVLVSPGELARLYRESTSIRAAGSQRARHEHREASQVLDSIGQLFGLVDFPDENQ
ncbi:GxGYxYP domain-containing protein [Aquisphaera insulae]|uniref:GxGYxYP domain-containing protein n=1 Tax=Aquisphaera insulae TaxID=2712864 RepID=UPI0013EC2F88|nr:GxGYxYP domain-containing protein [Aquisphaera insulae]